MAVVFFLFNKGALRGAYRATVLIVIKPASSLFEPAISEVVGAVNEPEHNLRKLMQGNREDGAEVVWLARDRQSGWCRCNGRRRIHYGFPYTRRNGCVAATFVFARHSSTIAMMAG